MLIIDRGNPWMAHNRPLNSDELGAKGERRFGEICADAKLICNQSDRDRSGWDFIVEFPVVAPTGPQTLDKRAAPISCHLQVKTLWSGNDRLKMRLSSAERLAKELKPAFVYVFTVDNNLQFSDSFLIHISGEILARILKCLRKEHSKGTKQINNKFISFSARRDGKMIGPTGEALRAEIVETCGTLSSYANDKAKELDNLGFEQFRFQTDMTLRIDNIEQLADVFFGKADVEVAEISAAEIRFGIKLPLSEGPSGKGRLSISPSTENRCRVVVRTPTTGPIELDAEAIFSPPALAEIIGRKILIRNDLLELLITSKSDGTNDISLTTNPDKVFNESKDIWKWLTYSKFLLALTNKDAALTVIPQNQNIDPIPLHLKTAISIEQTNNLIRLIDLLEATSRVLKFSGAKDHTFSFEQIANKAKAIIEIDRIIRNEPIDPWTVRVEANTESSLADIGAISTLVISFFEIGPIAIGYSFIAMLTPEFMTDLTLLRSSEIKFRDIEALQNLSADFDRFVDLQKSKNKERGLIVNHPDRQIEASHS